MSLTKIMTLYIVFDALKTKNFPNTKFKISKRLARQTPSKLNLSVVLVLQLKMLFYFNNKSANDVATVVAENLEKSERNFARLMTRKAKNWV